jgi:hypothetical protein
MDLSKFSDEDLKAIADGNVSAMSDEALKMFAEQPKQIPSLTAGQVATQAVTNFPSSFGGLVKDVYTAVTSPIETAKSVIDLGAGVLQNILPENLVQSIGEDKPSRDVARQVGQFYVDRYGSLDSAKQAIAKDPAGVMADAATLLFGAGAATPGRAGAALSKAGSVVDPFSAVAKGVAKGSVVAGRVVAPLAGMQTGVGSEPFKQAYRAGKEGGETAVSFRSNIAGEVAMTDVLEAAKANLFEMRRQKGEEYRAGMADISKDQTVLKFDGIDKTIENVSKGVLFKGKVKQKEAAQKLAAVKEEVANWKKLDPAEYHTPEGLDALKQSVGDILEGIPFESKSARYAVGQVYDSIRSEINKQAPTYSKVMKGYESASDQIKEIEKALSLGKKASADTAMRKLQSLMRDNVQTNYGQRVDLARKLEQAGGRDIMPALAGQSLSQLTPRGLQRATSIPTSLLAGYALNPALGVASLATSSPRLMGEAAYGAGLAKRGAGAVAEQMPFAVNPELYNLLYQSGQIKGLLEQ